MHEISQRLAQLENVNNPAIGNREIANLRHDITEFEQKNAELEVALARQRAPSLNHSLRMIKNSGII